MKRVHLLRVDAGPEAFGPLVAAAAAATLRVGWLDLRPPEPPAELERAAATGVLRAVAVGGGRSVSVKPLRGEPVLGDLVREHFRGCCCVLVRGEIEAPGLAPDGGAWRLLRAGREPLRLTTEELVARLRKARP